MKVLSFTTRGRPRSGRRHGGLRQPGSQGEHILQDRYGTTERAQQFYAKQVGD